MIRSMTGFAEKTISLSNKQGETTSASVSIKSVNSRFFELTCKLPPQLANLELSLSKLVKEALRRGHVYFTLYLNNQNIFKGAIEPSVNLIEQYVKTVHKINKIYPSAGPLSAGELLQLPHVFTVEEESLDNKSHTLLLDTAKELLDRVIAAQKQEGKSLQKDLQKRIAVMKKEIKAIEKKSAQLIIEHKQKISQLLSDVDTAETPLNEIQTQAAYALLDKMDINEEVVRFNSHLASLQEQMKSEKIEKGKRIDFTLQEMGREVNTISAKCSDASISLHAINIKVELEKSREQVQNII